MCHGPPTPYRAFPPLTVPVTPTSARRSPSYLVAHCRQRIMNGCCGHACEARRVQELAPSSYQQLSPGGPRSKRAAPPGCTPLAADRRRVAQPGGNCSDHLLELAFHLCLVTNSQFPQRRERLDRRIPGAKVFRGERPTAGLAQVLVDVVGIDPVATALRIDPLESSSWPGNICAAAHDPSPLRARLP